MCKAIWLWSLHTQQLDQFNGQRALRKRNFVVKGFVMKVLWQDHTFVMKCTLNALSGFDACKNHKTMCFYQWILFCDIHSLSNELDPGSNITNVAFEYS